MRKTQYHSLSKWVTKEKSIIKLCFSSYSQGRKTVIRMLGELLQSYVNLTFLWKLHPSVFSSCCGYGQWQVFHLYFICISPVFHLYFTCISPVFPVVVVVAFFICWTPFHRWPADTSIGFIVYFKAYKRKCELWIL